MAGSARKEGWRDEAKGEARPWKVTCGLINIVRVPARISCR